MPPGEIDTTLAAAFREAERKRPKFTKPLNGPEDIDPNKVPEEPPQEVMEAFLRRELDGTDASDAPPDRADQIAMAARLTRLEEGFANFADEINTGVAKLVNDFNGALGKVAEALAVMEKRLPPVQTVANDADTESGRNHGEHS